MSNLTVKELKELLENLPENAEIIFTMPEGCCGDKHYFVTPEIESWGVGEKAFVEIHFPEVLAGYKSCIQVGQTKKSDEAYWKKITGEKK